MIRNRTIRRGFTFLEIMFVVVIIGILLALVGPRLAGRAGKARATATAAQIQGLSTAIKNFEVDVGTFPKNLEELMEASSDNESSWDGPYVDGNSVPKDAWKQDFRYKFPGDHNKKGFDLWSVGPDKQDNTEDDVANWDKDKGK